GGHADPARGEPPVEAGTLAVRVDHLDLALADEPERRLERPGVEPVGSHLRDREPERAKPVEEDSVVGRRHRDLELVAGEPARQVVHLPRSTAERARREQLEDADHARAGDTEAAPSPCPGWRYSSRGGAKMSRTTQRVSSVRPPCGTFGGVCQKSPAFTWCSTPSWMRIHSPWRQTPHCSFAYACTGDTAPGSSVTTESIACTPGNTRPLTPGANCRSMPPVSTLWKHDTSLIGP